MADEISNPELAVRTINIESYRAKMEEVIKKYGLPEKNLEFVDEFPKDPYRTSRCFKVEGRILFRKAITDEAKEVMLAILEKRFEDKVALLEEDWSYIKHRLLSEICHILNRYKDDYECDKWAFYELTKNG